MVYASLTGETVMRSRKMSMCACWREERKLHFYANDRLIFFGRGILEEEFTTFL